MNERPLIPLGKDDLWAGQSEMFIAFEAVSGVPMFVGLGRPHVERQIEAAKKRHPDPERGYPYDFEIAGPFVLRMGQRSPRRRTASCNPRSRRRCVVTMLDVLRDLMLGGRHSRTTVARMGPSLPTADRWLKIREFQKECREDFRKQLAKKGEGR